MYNSNCFGSICIFPDNFDLIKIPLSRITFIAPLYTLYIAIIKRDQLMLDQFKQFTAKFYYNLNTKYDVVSCNIITLSCYISTIAGQFSDNYQNISCNTISKSMSSVTNQCVFCYHTCSWCMLIQMIVNRLFSPHFSDF